MYTASREAIQYSSQGVREQTAEIASWALSDAASVRSDGSARRHYASAISTTGAPDGEPPVEGASEQDEATPRDSHDSTRPGPIEEVSEPVSPESMHSSHQFPRGSVLSQLIRNSPPQEIEGNSAESTDDTEYLPTMTVTDRDSSPVDEESTLLHKSVPYTSHTTHDYGTTHDLEGQTSGGKAACQIMIDVLHWPRKVAPHAFRIAANVKSCWTLKGFWEYGCVQPGRYVPAVILGLLLNILDALSYGQCLLNPQGWVYADLSRHDFVSVGTTHLRRSWARRYIDVLHQLHRLSTRLFLWRKHLQRRRRVGDGN